jgi:tetratricopeptide (TPR) repeat protein
MSESSLCPDETAKFEEAVRLFECAWQGSERPDIENFVPVPRSDHTQLLFELVHVDLDLRLRTGEAVLVEHYLERFPDLEGDRDALLELIATEYALRRQWQTAPEPDEYYQRFPQYTDELRSRLVADRSGSLPSDTAEAPVPSVPGYELLRELGRGGMGVVYEARQTALGRIVAVKTLPAGSVGPGELARFRREIETISRLDHPHIVPVYEVGERGGVPYFSMKLYPGGSLARRSGTPTADPRADARTVETIARAVHHSHQRGVLHRDLKPSNILLDEAGQPHVADFGLAKQFDPTAGATMPSQIVGTPAYISPEQARGDELVTTASDVYGLGTILYELLTGEPPFQAETALATLWQVMERAPRPPRLVNPRVQADLETICLKCLEKEPARRYASALELAEDLARWQRGEPISVRPVGRFESVVRWCRRRPRDAALAALLFVLLALATGTAWWLDRSAVEQREALRQQELRQQVEQELLGQQARARVRGALAQIPSLRKRFLWSEAETVLLRAEQEVNDFALDDLHDDVRRAQREVAIAARLDEIRLDRVTNNDEAGAGRARAARNYREAFREYGLDFEAGNEAELIRRVRESASREELVDALHFCMWVDPQQSQLLKAVARAAEPDEWKALLAGVPSGPDVQEIQNRLKARLTAGTGAALTPGLIARLGRLLSESDEGLDLLLAVQPRYPADFWINYTLGSALSRRGRVDEGISYLWAALAARPHRGVIHHDLGIALRRTGRLEESLACHREAARLDPNKPSFLLGYGGALLEKGLHAEAITVFEDAHRLDPGSARAHCSLGRALLETGRFQEALVALRHGHELGSKDPTWREPSAEWVTDCERLLELDGRLSTVLAGESCPRNAEEQRTFARVCRYRGLHVRATGFYAAGGPRPADRSDAARSAILAATGRAADAKGLHDARRVELRRQALEWLKAELADLQRQVEKDGQKARPAVEAALRKWQHVTDLADVRDPAALARLPEPESRLWQGFWKRVAALLAR